MKFFYKIIAGFNLLPMICCGQQIVWQHHYGGNGYEETPQGWPLNSDILKNSNGEYIFAANTTSFGFSENQYAIKITANGDLIWELNAGNNYESDVGLTSIKTFDGNYFIAGYANMQSVNANDIRLTKFTDEGDTLFSKIVLADSLYPAIAHDICLTGDSNYIVACASYQNIFLVKFNNVGDTIWTKRPLPSSLGSGVPLLFQPSLDFSVYYGVSRHDNKYYWFKTDSLGQLISYKEIRFPEYEWLNGIWKVKMLQNGNLMVHGTARIDGNPYCENILTWAGIEFGFLHEYNANGEVVNERYFCWSSDSVVQIQFSDVAISDDGGFYLLKDKIIKKINSQWQDVWEFTLDLPYEIYPLKISQFEHGYLIASGQQWISSENTDIFICKIALPEALSINEENIDDKFNGYPNPVTNKLTIVSSVDTKINYFITSIDGKIISHGDFTTKIDVDFTNNASGIYYLHLFDNENKTLFRKLINKL